MKNEAKRTINTVELRDPKADYLPKSYPNTLKFC